MFRNKKNGYRIKWHTKYTIDEKIMNPKTKTLILKDELISWVKIILISVISIVLINQYIIVNALVPSGSMKNTIMPNDRLIASRLYYKIVEPKRGDVVVFKYPDDEEQLYVKRIIGLPGDKVTIIDGKVYINEDKEPLPDDYVTVEPMFGSFGPYFVPEDSYFMLGDNRNDSKDSRFWQNRFVSKEKILGKVIFKYHLKLQFLSK